jgi:tryptophan-rich sensory protein
MDNNLLKLDTYINNFDLFVQRLKDPNFLAVYVIIVVLWGVFLFSFISGYTSDWYTNLKHIDINPWIIWILWIIAGFISYIGLFILWENATETELPRDLHVTVLFLIGNFIFLGWSISLYQLENIQLAIWFSVALFIYQTWLVIYIWNINTLSGLLQIPILIMYLYLLYYTITLSSLNNISL